MERHTSPTAPKTAQPLRASAETAPPERPPATPPSTGWGSSLSTHFQRMGIGLNAALNQDGQYQQAHRQRMAWGHDAQAATAIATTADYPRLHALVFSTLIGPPPFAPRTPRRCRQAAARAGDAPTLRAALFRWCVERTHAPATSADWTVWRAVASAWLGEIVSLQGPNDGDTVLTLIQTLAQPDPSRPHEWVPRLAELLSDTLEHLPPERRLNWLRALDAQATRRLHAQWPAETAFPVAQAALCGAARALIDAHSDPAPPAPGWGAHHPVPRRQAAPDRAVPPLRLGGARLSRRRCDQGRGAGQPDPLLFRSTGLTPCTTTPALSRPTSPACCRPSPSCSASSKSTVRWSAARSGTSIARLIHTLFLPSPLH